MSRQDVAHHYEEGSIEEAGMQQVEEFAYQRGYGDGLSEGERRLWKKLQAEYARGWHEGIKQMNAEGERRGWEMGQEAAAAWLESQEGYGRRNRLEYAHGIRKLKKP